MMISPNNSFAQEDRGLLGGLEREQSDEAIPGQQPADIGGSAPLNRTLVEGDTSLSDGGASSACIPAQTAGGIAGNQATTVGNGTTTQGGATSTGTTNSTVATTSGGAGNQSTTSSPIQLIEQACMALQAGDTQGAMMQLNLALDQLRSMGGIQGGEGTTTQGGASSTTTGPGGIGTDDPSATDNPFSDLT
ncbi:MAG: hypothetical protein M3M87_06520 [Thermoproteota archaeon]|nr:hypothetical protein [Thermoproteota archaeon]